MLNFQILYNNIFSPDVFGFKSIKEMLKVLDNMVEIRNNVLYPKNEFTMYKQMDLKNDYINKQVLRFIHKNLEKYKIMMHIYNLIRRNHSASLIVIKTSTDNQTLSVYLI